MKDDPQLDMFDPIHVALLKESQFYSDQAAPFVAKANELKQKAYLACPHENIISDLISHEDEYGSFVSGWTEIHVECDFCHKRNWMNLKEFKKIGMTEFELLLLEKM